MKDTLFITMADEGNEIYSEANAQFDIDEPNATEMNIIASSVVGMMGATSEMYYEKHWRFEAYFVEAEMGFKVTCEGDYPNVHVVEYHKNVETLYEGDMGYYYAADMLKEWIAGGIDEA